MEFQEFDLIDAAALASEAEAEAETDEARDYARGVGDLLGHLLSGNFPLRDLDAIGSLYATNVQLAEVLYPRRLTGE